MDGWIDECVAMFRYRMPDKVGTKSHPPLLELMTQSEAMRSGAIVTIFMAIMPPMENPTTCTFIRQRKWSRMARTSRAMKSAGRGDKIRDSFFIS